MLYPVIFYMSVNKLWNIFQVKTADKNANKRNIADIIWADSIHAVYSLIITRS